MTVTVDHYKGIPKKVRVGCYWFKVQVGEIGDHECDGTFGHMNPVNRTIQLRPGMPAQGLANTFIHECIHAMNNVSRAGYGLMDSYSDTEEDFTHKIANGLCSFWLDNPKVAAWWVKINQDGAGGND